MYDKASQTKVIIPGLALSTHCPFYRVIEQGSLSYRGSASSGTFPDTRSAQGHDKGDILCILL
jgi:hypothetical protein